MNLTLLNSKTKNMGNEGFQYLFTLTCHGEQIILLTMFGKVSLEHIMLLQSRGIVFKDMNLFDIDWC